MRSLRSVLLVLALTGSAAFAADSSAANPAAGFILTLSTQEQLDAGLGKLNAEQQVALNTLVAREVALARENGLTGFAGTFLSRPTDEEKARAGLDRLTDAERKRLDELVATALSARVAGPRSRPRLKDSDINGPARKTEVHGSVSVGYGWGRGGEVRTGSVYVHTYDPDSGIGIGIGVSTINGNGLWGWPGYYDSFSGYPYDYRYYSPAYRYPIVIRDGFGPGSRMGLSLPPAARHRGQTGLPPGAMPAR